MQIGHDPQRARHDQQHDEHAEGKRERVIGVVGPACHVQEESQVNAHLRDREHGEAERDAGHPEERCIGRPKGRCGEDHGEDQGGRVDEPVRRPFLGEYGRRFVVCCGQGRAPIRWRTENSAT